MMLSLFIRNKEFHVAYGDFEHIYKVTESCEMADAMPMFLKEALDSIAFEQCDTVLYSSGPASFTTSRIMTSLIKGIAISCPDLKFIGISNFLTYLHVASQDKSTGLIAIPTMRGDYFTATFKGEELGRLGILSDLPTDALLDSSEVFRTSNLASIQATILNTNIAKINTNYIQSTLDINYGFTPEYRASASRHK